ncbi:MAG: TolC family protein [Planctomycetaceae bacterium]|nr:TolC family protein [Planctomycetaceae bacterium]
MWRKSSNRLLFCGLLLGTGVGCTADRYLAHDQELQPAPSRDSVAQAPNQGYLDVTRNSLRDSLLAQNTRLPRDQDEWTNVPVHRSEIRTAALERDAPQTNQNRSAAAGHVTIDGQTYELRPVSKATTVVETRVCRPYETPDDGLRSGVDLRDSSATRTADHSSREPFAGSGSILPVSLHDSSLSTPAPAPPMEDQLQLNLPTALSMVGGTHPAIGFAQWRVQEAYAQLEQTRVLWLPSIRPGISFHRHDGNYQASDGRIVDVNRSSMQFGLGTGATGAGTTPRPGLVAQFHLADALLEPAIAEKTAWARSHAANSTVNEHLLAVANGYLELLSAEQSCRVIEASRAEIEIVSQLTRDFAETGQGLQSDADRMQTELFLIDARLSTARENADVASARLCETLGVHSGKRIYPADPTVVPLHLVDLTRDQSSLIGTGLMNRPELKEAQALVAAACERHERQKLAPFVPSVLLGFSTGGFGGDIGTGISSVGDRYDFDAELAWEVRNLGFGDQAAQRQTESRIQQARFEKIRVLDRVAREVSEAHAQVQHRLDRISNTESAVSSATDSYERNLARIRDGQGLPLEVLQSVRALEESRLAYLQAITDYNAAQFRLQWALGWPLTAETTASAHP